MKNTRLHIIRRQSRRHQSKGFTLIASLLMLLLLSGIAIGLMMMVNTEGKVGGTDLQNNVAYHAAEGGIEKMASDLTATFQNSQVAEPSQICAVSNTPPSMTGITFTQYSVAPASGCSGTLVANWGQLNGGPDQGLWAQIIPVNMLATAQSMGGQEVSMTRGAQVALIPVFQFGVFCEGDCGFFDSPTLDFVGRVHTNGDLYLGVSNGATLTFHNRMQAYGNVVTEVLPNGLPVTGGSWDDTGNVNIPTANNGCSPPIPPATAASYPPTGLQNCVLKDANSNPAGGTYGDGSVQGAGGNPPSTYNGANAWNTFSQSTTSHMIINANYGSKTNVGTGAKKLSMPFVGGNLQPYEIIRRPPSGELSTSVVGSSREYNMAQIRVLLSDDPAELSSSGASDTNNVRLANVTQAQATATGQSVSNPFGIAMAAGNYAAAWGAPGAGNTFNLYFAAASNAVPVPSSCAGIACATADWPFAPATPAAGAQTLVPTAPAPGAPINPAQNNGTPVISLCPPPNVASPPANCPTTITYPYYPSPNAPAPSNLASSTSWNLIDGWLRVEYKDASGVWHPVTNEWLQLGFARGVTPPSTGNPNLINPNAILLLQEPADRSVTSTLPPSLSSAGTPPVCTATSGSVCTAWTPASVPQLAADTAAGPWPFGITPSAPPSTTPQSITQYNWYPINFYDAREGEPRDIQWSNGRPNDNSCTTNGVMNAVEIDVGNLKRWLTGAIGTNGPNVDFLGQNGYVLYFSDRRGMLPNPNSVGPNAANTKSGDSGLEDAVNATSAAGTPDGALEPKGTKAYSPEDVNLNGVLDNFGTANLGLGFYGTGANANQNLNAQIIAAAPDDNYSSSAYNARIASCATTARKNWVSGARHALKLVDGGFGNVPLRTDAGASLAAPGGFTVASENPVYVQGNYNSNAADNFWPNGVQTGVADQAGHAAAAVIADAVTLLSNNWKDQYSLMGNPALGNKSPTLAQGNRPATTTFYRLAVAGGKNMAFPFPGWENAVNYGLGTDGGVHNFLRFLEDWQTTGSTLNYGGSLVSLYYSTYSTGPFKCCQYSVYQPPIRHYIFDTDFTLPQGLPPGTPLFRDVESLTYRQLFATRKTGE